jgi:hypothetical protein
MRRVTFGRGLHEEAFLYGRTHAVPHRLQGTSPHGVASSSSSSSSSTISLDVVLTVGLNGASANSAASCARGGGGTA